MMWIYEMKLYWGILSSELHFVYSYSSRMILYSTKFKEKPSPFFYLINIWSRDQFLKWFSCYNLWSFYQWWEWQNFCWEVCISLNEKIIPSNFSHRFVTLMFDFFYSSAGFNFNIPLLVFFLLVSLFLGWQEV